MKISYSNSIFSIILQIIATGLSTHFYVGHRQKLVIQLYKIAPHKKALIQQVSVALYLHVTINEWKEQHCLRIFIEDFLMTPYTITSLITLIQLKMKNLAFKFNKKWVTWAQNAWNKFSQSLLRSHSFLNRNYESVLIRKAKASYFQNSCFNYI